MGETELVQETAARGLTMAYERGDKETKEDLVRSLVSSFTGERTRTLTGNVSADTELFEPGALPTGDGSISTYKDVRLLYDLLHNILSNAAFLTVTA